MTFNRTEWNLISNVLLLIEGLKYIPSISVHLFAFMPKLKFNHAGPWRIPFNLSIWVEGSRWGAWALSGGFDRWHGVCLMQSPSRISQFSSLPFETDNEPSVPAHNGNWIGAGRPASGQIASCSSLTHSIRAACDWSLLCVSVHLRPQQPCYRSWRAERERGRADVCADCICEGPWTMWHSRSHSPGLHGDA